MANNQHRLLAEHRALGCVIDGIETFARHRAARGTVAGLARVLAGAIEAHAAGEEPVLYEHLNDPRCAQAVHHALAEHVEIRALFAKATSGDRRALVRVCGLLRGHFEEEERDVFPYV